MIQDIFPHKLNNEFICKEITENDVVFVFRDNKVLCNDKSEMNFPLFKNIETGNHEFIYLFEIDSVDFFLAVDENIKVSDEFAYENINIFRTMSPKHLAFSGITAYHLHNWYNGNKFCGRCSSTLVHSKKERCLVCNKCNNLIFPKISPVIIVGISDGDKLLMSKYAHGDYKKYSLIAGFIEIGESAEEAAIREAAEEVGIKIKDIKYYKSQPWGFSGSLLLGYFARLDGNSDLLLDKNELSEAVWVNRDDISMEIDNLSLTNEMICNFKFQNI